METIYGRISEIIVSLGVTRNELDLKARFSADLGLDSLDMAELITLWEAEFKIDIPDSDIYHFTKVGDVVQYIHTKLHLMEEPISMNMNKGMMISKIAAFLICL